MLLLLMPEQISNYWEDIKAGLNDALPPGAPDRNQRLLGKMLTGTVQVWISYHHGVGESVVDGAVVTSVIEDRVHDTRNLLLYALWTIGDTRSTTWREGIKALKKYAQGRMCSRVVAYSDQEEIIEMAKALGGEAKYIFVTWEL